MCDARAQHQHCPPNTQHTQGELIGLLALSTLINHTAMGDKERRHTACERYLWRKDTEPPNGISAQHVIVVAFTLLRFVVRHGSAPHAGRGRP